MMLVQFLVGVQGKRMPRFVGRMQDLRITSRQQHLISTRDQNLDENMIHADCKHYFFSYD